MSATLIKHSHFPWRTIEEDGESFGPGTELPIGLTLPEASLDYWSIATKATVAFSISAPGSYADSADSATTIKADLVCGQSWGATAYDDPVQIELNVWDDLVRKDSDGLYYPFLTIEGEWDEQWIFGTNDGTSNEIALLTCTVVFPHGSEDLTVYSSDDVEGEVGEITGSITVTFS